MTQATTWSAVARSSAWIVTGPPEEPGGRAAEGGLLTYIFVQVETDEGLTGWGEVTTYPGPVANRAIAAALRATGAATACGARIPSGHFQGSRS